MSKSKKIGLFILIFIIIWFVMNTFSLYGKRSSGMAGYASDKIIVGFPLNYAIREYGELTFDIKGVLIDTIFVGLVSGLVFWKMTSKK